MSEPQIATSHRDYIDEQLRVTRARVAEINDAFASRERESEWHVRCEQREQHAEALGAQSPAGWLTRRLGLSPTELRVIWILIAHELCPATRSRLRELATEQEADVTLDVLRRCVYGPQPEALGWKELSADGALRRWCLIEPVNDANIPEHRTTFRVSRRVIALVHGVIGLDDEIRAVAMLDDVRVDSEDLVVASDTLERVRASMRRARGLTILHGGNGTGRRSLVLAAAGELDCNVLTVTAGALAAQRELADRQLRIIARECRLLDRTPLVRELDLLGRSGEVPDRLDLFESRLDGLVVATTSRGIARRWKVSPTMIDVPALNRGECARLWQRSIPTSSEADADFLSTIYPLAPALIDAVGKAAVAQADGTAMTAEHIEAGLRSVLDDRLAGLATRVTVTQRWDDLVLPEDQTMAMVELLARIRTRRRVYEEWGFGDKLGRGLGVSALFSGPPGTGKTMCAGLIAKDLRTELYQVDLGKIVSKWIGETEKNLGALFDAAEAGHAILLFDEADALFGKRTSVKSSNDRYANQETNYLLQRIESFTGICILTTNHETAIDEAFRRRLAVHVSFPVPDAGEREKLWRALLPERAPVEPELDLSSLARKYVMSGGYIRNAMLRAAFLAADADEPIGDYHLTRAAQLEYESMGKLASAI